MMVFLARRFLKKTILIYGSLILFYIGLYSTILKWAGGYDMLPFRDIFDKNFKYHLGRGLINPNVSASHNHVNPGSVFVFDVGNETQFNFRKIVELLEAPWKNNISYISEFRQDLSKFTGPLGMLFVTKENTNVGTKVPYVWRSKEKATISRGIYKYLQKHLPFTGNYSRCSVVGNSGILNNSSCGADIDKSDFIIRCNAPPITKFEFDAGRKSNITTLNPSILKRSYNLLRKKGDIKKYLNAMKQYNKFIWLPSFATSFNLPLCARASRAVYTPKNYQIQIIHGHPQHFIKVMDFWKQKGVNKIITTGFYMTNVALQLCNEVHLYGFWPFNVDPNKNQIAYHYFDDVLLGNGKSIHNISSEFKALLQLHKIGALRIHLHC